MNLKELLKSLNKKYNLLIEGEMPLRGYYRFKIKYESIEFFVTYTYTGMVTPEDNYRFICKKIENELIDYFKR